jgi:phage terminase large subunit
MADQAILAPKVRDHFFDSNGNWIPSRYKVMHGGRGGLKTWGFGRVAVLLAAKRKTRFLCARELQTSIQESVHYTLKEQIELLGFERYFDVQQRTITSSVGSEFIFSGIRNNPKKIKSTEGIDVCWVEEAENITEESWQILIPTVRKPFSEIWVGFNPDLETDPTSARFITTPPPNARIITTNWRDNPWLSDELRAEKDYLAKVDPDAYQHVWEGGFRTNSEAQVLRGKYCVEAFEPGIGWNGPYQGCDFGYVDPTVLMRLWIHDRKLFVEYEAYAINADINDLPELFDHIPLARQYVTRADNARPETISYLRNAGYPKMESCEKWKGSVEDGVAYLRQFEKIVIHPRCKHAAEEARLWSYKVDRLSGDVLPDLKDGNDHCWDASRYGLQPLIKDLGTWGIVSL